MYTQKNRETLTHAFRKLPIALACLLLLASVSWAAKVGLQEKGGSQYTITVDGVMLTDPNGAPKLYDSLDSATEVAKIYLQNDPNADVVITGIQHYDASISSGPGRGKGRNKGGDSSTVDDPAPEDPVVEDPAPEDPAPEDPAPEDPAVEDPMPEDPAAEDPAAEDPAAEEPAAEDPAPEEPVIDEPEVLEPIIEFLDRQIEAPSVDLDALTQGATTIWVSPDGPGDGRSADHPTTLAAAVAAINEAGGGHFVIRLANGERHTLTGVWPATAKGESETKPIVLMPAVPQGDQPIVVGFAGAPGIHFESPRNIIVHGIQFGSYLAEGVRLVAGADGDVEGGILFDGCTMFGSVHGVKVVAGDNARGRAKIRVENCLIADNRSDAFIATNVDGVQVYDSSIAFGAMPQEPISGVKVVGCQTVDVKLNTITRASGPAVRVIGGLNVTVSDNVFVANVSSGEVCHAARSVTWTRNVSVNGLGLSGASGLNLRCVTEGTVSENLFVNGYGSSGPAIALGRSVGEGDENIRETVITDNIVYDAHRVAFVVDWLIAENVKFSGNIVQSSSAVGKPEFAGRWVTDKVSDGISAAGDRFALSSVVDAMRVGRTSGGYDLWTQLTGGSVATAPVRFVDPTRDGATYNRIALGGDESVIAMSEAIRKGEVETAPLAEWIRAGFRIASVEDDIQDPPAPPEDPIVPEEPVTPEEPSEPEAPVEPDPPADDEGRVVIYVDAVGGPTKGNDANDGLTPQTAVATHGRAKQVAYYARTANPNVPLTFRFRCGDEFPAFDMCLGFLEDPTFYDTGVYTSVPINGTPDNYTVFTSFGDGERPVFRGPGNLFRMKPDNTVNSTRGNYFEFRGLKGIDGALLSWIGVGGGLRIIDCVGDNAPIVVQCTTSGARLSGLEIRNTVILNCLSDGPHIQGIFINNVDDWIIEDCVLYRNGWNGTRDTPDGDLGVDLFNHGVYVTGTSGPGQFNRNVCAFNAGAGAQIRSSGDVKGNFVAWNGRTGLDWGLVNGSKTDDKPGSGEVTGNLIFDSLAWGLAIGDIGSGRVHGNTLVATPGSMNRPLYIESRYGPNPSGGQRYGINNLVVENNLIVGDAQLTYGGWGFLGEEGVTIRNNQFVGRVTYELRDTKSSKYSDPLGKVHVAAGQENSPNPGIAVPERTEELVAKILSGELTAAELIATFGP